MNRFLPWLALGAVVYLVWKGSQRELGGAPTSGNLGTLQNQEAATFDPSALRASLLQQAAAANVVQQVVATNPALGTSLGLSPQQTEYLSLGQTKFEQIYGFNPPPAPSSAAGPAPSSPPPSFQFTNNT